MPDTYSFPTFIAEHLLSCQNNLGESVTWDSRRQLLHWIDIEKAEIHTLDPATNAHVVEVYPDLGEIGCIVLKEDGDGFIGNSLQDFVLFPQARAPSDEPTLPHPIQRRITKLLCSPVAPEVQNLPNSRLNDGACDRNGCYFTGNLTVPEYRGNVWRYDHESGSAEVVFDGIGISNGIDFSPDGRTMYYIDTMVLGAYQYDYDEATGLPSNRRLFARSPFEARSDRRMSGRFDGICVDAEGNVWAAELGESAIVGWRPNGEVICAVRVPRCTTTTICCFGGPKLDAMYITTGHSKYAGIGEVQSEFPWSGDLFKFELAPGSEARTLLGETWSGGERNRFRG